MLVVVEQDIANHLVEHGEQGAEGSQPGEVHDVLLGGCVLKTLGYQVVRGKEWLDYCRHLVLHLELRWLALKKTLIRTWRVGETSSSPLPPVKLSSSPQEATASALTSSC